MDLSKAFDVVPHESLLNKLNWYGVSGTTNKWIRSFLTDRQQKVVVDGAASSKAAVTSGVPQGTVLGPALFLAYINDLPDVVSHSTVRLFADDCILYRQIRSATDVNKLQQDLTNLEAWEKQWLMQFNPSKCCKMAISLARKKQITASYTLHNTTLEEVTSTKYLGVTIQSNLQWDQHIHEKTAKANRTLGLLKRNVRTPNKNTRENAYKTLVRPHLEYAAAVWSPWQQKYIHDVEKIQRRAARYVCRDYGRMSSVTSMLQSMNWETLETRRKKARTTLMYKCINGLVAIPLSPYFTVGQQRSTRHSHLYNINIPLCRIDCYKFSFFPQTIRMWNSLPSDIVEAPLEKFKASLGGLAAKF